MDHEKKIWEAAEVSVFRKFIKNFGGCLIALPQAFHD